jgi:hypothetical protein
MRKFDILPLITVLVFSTFLITETAVSQTESEDRDSRLLSLLKNDVFSVSGLIQAYGRFSFEDDNFNGGRTFQAGNARLAASGVLNQDFDYRFQFNFAREPNLLDAYIGYNYSEGFRIRAGAHKPVISAEYIPSPGIIDFISRARLVGTFFKPREIGVSFYGDIDRFYYNVGVYNGTGLTTNVDNRFFYTTRFAYNMDLQGDDVLRIGGNFAFGESFGTTSGTTNIQLAGNRYIYGADVRYESDTWIFAAEVLAGDLEVTNYIAGPEEHIVSYYFTGGYKLSDQTQVLARWDHLGFQERDRRNNQFILGFTHYATDLISFKINLISQFDEVEDNRMGLSTSLQFQF